MEVDENDEVVSNTRQAWMIPSELKAFISDLLAKEREKTIEAFGKELDTYPAVVSLIEKVRDKLKEK